jgi:hypothetical protein
VYLGAFLRAAVEGAGGYDERFLVAEDWDLNHRMREAGGLIWFQPELRVSYRPRASVAALAAQYFGYGRWRRVVARRHAGTINLRYLTPPVVTAAILVGLVAGLAGFVGVVAGAGDVWLALLIAGFAVPAVYLLGVLTVSATAARGSGALRGRPLAWLPVALVTMHMCWGLGFLSSPRHLVPGRGADGEAGSANPGGIKASM